MGSMKRICAILPSRKSPLPFDATRSDSVHRDIPKYMDRPDIRALLGVDKSLNSTYAVCSLKVNWDFTYGSLDYLHTSDVHVAALLERGIKVLTFVGKNDFVCSHVGNRKWVMGLDWTGREGFAAAETKDWSLPHSAVKAGTVQSFGGLTFLDIDGAGHLVSSHSSSSHNLDIDICPLVSL
jgi:cathepsin A (carboxypeptidase C)